MDIPISTDAIGDTMIIPDHSLSGNEYDLPNISQEKTPNNNLSPVNLITIDETNDSVTEEKGSYDSFFTASDIWTTETLFLGPSEYKEYAVVFCLHLSCPTKIVSMRTDPDIELETTTAFIGGSSNSFNFTSETIFEAGDYYIYAIPVDESKTSDITGVHLDLSMKHSSTQSTFQLLSALVSRLGYFSGQELNFKNADVTPSASVHKNIISQIENLKEDNKNLLGLVEGILTFVKESRNELSGVVEKEENSKLKQENSNLQEQITQQSKEITECKFELETLTRNYDEVYEKLYDAEEYIDRNLKL